MTATLINSFIALILGTCAIKYRNTSFYVIFILFIYISLHYSYSAIAIFAHPNQIYLMMRSNTQIGAKIIGFGFLFLTIGLLILTKWKILLRTIQKPTVYIYFIVILWIIAIGISWLFYLFQGNYPSFLSLQNVISSFLMLILAFLIAGVAAGFNKEVSYSLEKMLLILLLLVIIMDIISLYQIIANKIFAGVPNANGEYESRACAIFLNPNLFALWCAFISSATAYAYHTKRYSRIKTFFMLGLIALGIFLSGSRSGLIICLFMLFSVSFLQFQFKRWAEIKFAFYPLFLLFASFTGMSIFFKLADALTKNSYKWLHSLSILVDRFSDITYEIFIYGSFKFYSYLNLLFAWLSEHTTFSIFNDSYIYFGGVLSEVSKTKVFTNIDGRINPSAPEGDNGFIIMYNDTGWSGLILWLILWLFIVCVGIKSFRINSGINSVYALSAIMTCLFSSVFIRSFQVYPIWIMVSISLGLSLSWFQAVIDHKGANE